MENRINAYQIMWLFVMFDLPTQTKVQRTRYRRFRTKLECAGFNMEQFSVYVRACGSPERMEMFQRRVVSFLPEEGQVSFLAITDKQYSAMLNFFNQRLETHQQRHERGKTQSIDADGSLLINFA